MKEIRVLIAARRPRTKGTGAVEPISEAGAIQGSLCGCNMYKYTYIYILFLGVCVYTYIYIYV
jgi:hypothetical protein